MWTFQVGKYKVVVLLIKANNSKAYRFNLLTKASKLDPKESEICSKDVLKILSFLSSLMDVIPLHGDERQAAEGRCGEGLQQVGH